VDAKKEPQHLRESGEHLQHIRRRFTETAGAFAQFVLAGRLEESKHAAEALTRDFAGAHNASALDLCCGPGTFVRAMAAHVRSAVGLDITAAMLERARQQTMKSGLVNVSFVSADVNALPFRDESWDIVFCGYALHHLLRPDHVVAEMAQVVRSGGRLGITDMFVPDGADSETLNRIERLRDPSHATTLKMADLRRLICKAGLREIFIQPHERHREFNDWMHVGGHKPGSPEYVQVRRLMEDSLQRDVTGYRPRIDSETGKLHFTQHAILILAEKP
jgi:ubiquinone/menaquinone biosynthesis C-methylase UbiE